jgi:hypothetical protein
MASKLVSAFHVMLLPFTLRTNCKLSRSSSPGEGKNVLFSTSSRPVLRPTQPLTQWALGHLSPGIKLSGLQADYSPTSTDVKET